MSILRKEYELSVWEDIQEQYDDGEIKRYRVQEKRVAIIGSHQMKTQNKAISPKLTRNINGSINFSFSMLTKYNDNITGEEKINPYVELLKNETKLKLYYDSNWYDLIIKKIDEDSANSQNTYSAISQHINELSRNGFNVELTDDLGNNTDDIFSLAERILQDTDWTVDKQGSDFTIETREESLIPLKTLNKVQIIYVIEPSSTQKGTSWQVTSDGHVGKVVLPAGSLIYAFYSSCSGKPNLFQFYAFGEFGTNSDPNKIPYNTFDSYEACLKNIELDQNRVIQNKGCQFCVIVPNEGSLNQYTTELADYGFTIPSWCEFNPVREDSANPSNLSYILTKIKGQRYVFSEDSIYEPNLKAVLYKQRGGINEGEGENEVVLNGEYWLKKEVEFFEPAICTNLAGNMDFTSSAGWQSSVVCDIEAARHEDFQSYKYKKSCKPGQETLDFLTNWTGEEDLIPFLTYQTNMAAPPIIDENPNLRTLQCLIGNGPNNQKSIIKSFTKGEQYEVLIKFKNVNQIKVENIDSKEPESATIELAHHPYDADKGVYLFVPEGTPGRSNYSKVFSEASSDAQHRVGMRLEPLTKNPIDGINAASKYYRATLTIAENVSEEELKKYTVQLFLYPDGYNDKRFNDTINTADIRDINIEEFYFYKKQTTTVIDANTGKQKTINLTPFTDPSIYSNSLSQITYKYYSFDQIENLQKGILTAEQLTPVRVGNGSPAKKQDGTAYLFESKYHEDGKKIRRIQLNDSNYFNGISALSETFSQWPVFNIERDSNGRIINKKIQFKNYVGAETTFGFRTGINLQSIKRNVNSQNITTKMIVKPNNNKVAKNGYCSIDEATANETGENTLYDFSYYINKQLIDKDQLQYILYNSGIYSDPDKDGRGTFFEMFGADVVEFYPGVIPETQKDAENNQLWSCQNFYTRLKILNNKILKASNDGVQQRLILLEEKSKLDFQQRAIAAAEESAEEVRIKFEETAGQALPDMNKPLSESMKQLLEQSDTLTGYIREYLEYIFIINKNSADLNALTERVNDLEDKIAAHSENIVRWTDYKQKLMKSFFELYGRFIQEGTWIDEKYSDPELYYTDALSTLYTSAKPQIQYTINVSDISSLPGYEHNRFGLGDKSYVEDEEFFGYDEEGFPYKEEVVLTEITNELDNSSKDSIKVQNYKTQFEDLFQRITASVQQTKLLEGAYKKAVNRTTEDSNDAIQFLETALGDENLELKKRGAQSISWTTDGLIITDDTSPSQRLRLIGGQILYSLVKSDGSLIWKTLLSTDGMSAAKLTAGTLNTDNIEIMSKGVPTLRLNKLGLTAYDWKNSLDDKTEVDLSRGIRFDKTGIYGYDTGVDTGDDRVPGPEFLPWKEDEGKTASRNLDEASNYISQHEKVAFYLGWDGLHVKGQNQTKLRIGKNNNSILDIANSTGESIFNVSNDGIIKLCGSSGWTINTGSITTGTLGSSGSFHMYSTGISGSAFGINTDWLLRIGTNFGVTKTGDLYCSSGSFKGKIDAIKGGTIAGWAIGDGNLSYNLDSFEDAAWNESGFYLSDQGIRFTHYGDGSSSLTTEWYVNGTEGAMYFGIQKAFTNVWGNKNTVSKLNLNMSIDRDGLIYYLTDSNNKFYFGTWLTPQWIKIGVDAASVGMSSPGSSVITEQEELTIYALSATSFQADRGGIYSKFYGNGFSRPGWIMYWDENKYVYFPNKVFLGNDTKSLDERLSDLGFKGPYDIKYGSAQGTKIGRIYQQGNLVYGAIHKDLPQKAEANKLLFICREDTSTQMTIPGPIVGQTINWIHGGSSQYYIGVVLSKNSNGYLEMKTHSDGSNNASGVYGNWSYFCYETKVSDRQPNAT